MSGMSIYSLFARLDWLQKHLTARNIGDYRDEELVFEYFKLRKRMKGY